jgi:hypothetical protein
MSLDGQTHERKVQIFKSALKFQESAAGIVVQRIPGSYLRRILKPLIDARKQAIRNGTNPNRVNPRDLVPDTDDPLVHEIYDIDRTFSYCKGKGVDVLASAEGIAMEWEEDGAPGHGCMILAWKTTFDRDRKRTNPPELVGAITLHKFKSTHNFSTEKSQVGEHDFAVLSGQRHVGNNERRNYFSRNTMYIDALCAKGKGGVGKLLILHAIRWALTRKCTGLIALSYSNRKPKNASDRPESYALFTDFGFERPIPKANFTVSMYGTWFFKPLNTLGFEQVLHDAITICTRTGFTDATKDRLIWRCPN